MNVMDALTSSKSVRSFTGKIADEELKAVLAAAQASAVGNAADDTVKLTVITDEALLSQIDANAATFFGDPSALPPSTGRRRWWWSRRSSRATPWTTSPTPTQPPSRRT